MEKLKYKSLEWIHKVREENYNKTKDLSPTELIEKTRKATDAAIKAMELKIVRLKLKCEVFLSIYKTPPSVTLQ